MKHGYIYVAYNPLYRDNIYKIGRTDRQPTERMEELYTTGVPVPFKLLGYSRVQDSAAAERRLHDRLASYRVNHKREFFNLTEKQALQALQSVRLGFFQRCKNATVNLMLGITLLLWNLLLCMTIIATIGYGTYTLLKNPNYYIGGSILLATIPTWFIGKLVGNTIKRYRRV